MTPFGDVMRDLRRRKGVTQREMAAGLGVSPPYLSALEHGNRSAPSFDFIQRVAGYFNIIWDDLDDLMRVADLSHPRIVLDTAGLSSEYTALANRMAHQIRQLDRAAIAGITAILDQCIEQESK
jgi:transcriptional regulator with XRE-family HTH domain